MYGRYVVDPGTLALLVALSAVGALFFCVLLFAIQLFAVAARHQQLEQAQAGGPQRAWGDAPPGPARPVPAAPAARPAGSPGGCAGACVV